MTYFVIDVTSVTLVLLDQNFTLKTFCFSKDTKLALYINYYPFVYMYKMF